MDLQSTLDELIPHEKLHYLTLTLDTAGLHTRVLDGAIIASGPLDFIVKNQDELVYTVSADVVATFEFALKNFVITSRLEVEVEENQVLTKILKDLIADPWTQMFKDGLP